MLTELDLCLPRRARSLPGARRRPAAACRGAARPGAWPSASAGRSQIDARFRSARSSGVGRAAGRRDAGRACRGSGSRQPTTYIFVLWMVGSSLVLLAIASVFMRNQVRSLRRLAVRRRELRQGPRRAELQARGCDRSAPSGARLHQDARPHPAPDHPAHRDAGRRLARSAHAADAHEARARADAGRARRRRAQVRRRRRWSAWCRAISISRAAKARKSRRDTDHRAADPGADLIDAQRDGAADLRRLAGPTTSCCCGRTRRGAASPISSAMRAATASISGSPASRRATASTSWSTMTGRAFRRSSAIAVFRPFYPPRRGAQPEHRRSRVSASPSRAMWRAARAAM